MKIYITYLGHDYTITFEYDDPVTKCYLEDKDEPMCFYAIGETKRHPKDSPNWVIARRQAFENMLKDSNKFFGDEAEYLKFYHIAWLHFMDVVKDRI